MILFSAKNIDRRNPKNIFKIDVEQRVFREEISPSVTVKPKEKERFATNDTEIFVPSYWKSGYTERDTSDYLKGYIPSISWFKRHFTTYQDMKFGVSKVNEYNVEEITPLIQRENIFKSKGMLNESVFFGWNSEECKSSYSEVLDNDVYYCKNWLNWLGGQKEQKSYVFTDCKVYGKSGYCVFEDYVRVYYDLNMSSEVRCFGSTSDDYLCNFDNYLSLIKI